MLIFFNLFCGITALIYGVYIMSEGLKKANTNVIKNVLSFLTRKRWLSFLVGIGITSIVQSSSAVTVMTISFVSAKLMSLVQAMGIIYGANIGTTITAQLMTFSLSKIGLPVLIVGIFICFIAKKEPTKNIGLAGIGLGLMFIGLQILGYSVPYIIENPHVYQIFIKYGQNPLIGLIIGILTTILVQSSSATIGITIVLFNAQLISLESAIGFTLGDNIGTCITALLASIKTDINGKRIAFAHTLYNVIGVCIAFAFLHPFSSLVQITTHALGQNETRLVANTHTLFNCLNALIFLPFTKYYVAFIKRLI